MRDRAWCGAHDRSAEFVTTDQERVCFSGLGNAETTCRIETETRREDVMRAALEQLARSPELGAIARDALVEVAALPENDTETGSVEIHVDCEGCAENTAIVRALVEAEERLAQIAELSKAALGTTWTLRDTLRMIEDIARGGEPA